jgi:hypothetical protein
MALRLFQGVSRGLKPLLGGGLGMAESIDFTQLLIDQEKGVSPMVKKRLKSLLLADYRVVH